MGPTANILTAIVLMIFVFQVGFPEPAFIRGPALVGAVEPDSPAQEAGILPGDLVLRLGDEETPTWRDLQIAVTLSPGQEVEVVLEREGQTLSKTVVLNTVSRYRIGDAGISPSVPALVAEVEPGMPASEAGLQPGDQILRINGEPIFFYGVATRIIHGSAGETVQLSILRDGQEQETSLIPAERDGEGMIGVRWSIPETIRKYPLPGAVAASLRWNWKNVDLVFTTIGKLLSGALNMRTMSGPIDIYKISGQTFRAGWIPFVQFMALVSLQLGIINLFPFPVLDGGHILILLVEGVARRDLSLKIKERMMQVGFYLLLLLMGTVIYLDISKNFFE